MGYGNEFGWLASANVTFTTKSHRDFKPYPASAKMPRAFAPLSHSAKVRLRAPRSAQDDIQNDYLAVCVRFFGPSRTPVPTKNNKIHCRGDSHFTRFYTR